MGHGNNVRSLCSLAVLVCMVGSQAQTLNENATRRVAETVGKFNPDVSAVLDILYHDDDVDGIGRWWKHVGGFGPLSGGGHAHEDHHANARPGQGFDLRHIELVLSAAVDPYARGMVNVAVTEDGAELEEAWFETLALPAGLKLKGGKFYSDFGYINPQHPHQWDFTDQPLVYRWMFGEHGLNDKGVQLTWLAPTPWYLLFGVEAFQGGETSSFGYKGEEPWPQRDAPRVGVAWVKFGPDLPARHGLQLGLFGLVGRNQIDALHDHDHHHHHDEEVEEDSATEPVGLDGESWIGGGDFVYKYDAPKAYGEGDVIVQGEYARRESRLERVGEGRSGRVRATQDGYYLQAVYGFAPRWRIGVRWEQVGVVNRIREAGEPSQTWDPSWRASAMVDFSPSEFSRFRVQVSRGRYELEDGAEEATEVWLQTIFSIGAHGAHKF